MRWLLWKMAVWVAVAMLGAAVVVCSIGLYGCRQMPVLQGQFQEARVEQTKVDAKQSDRIADLTEIEEGLGTVLTVVAPEEQKPAVRAVTTRITAVKAQAQAQAQQHRNRAAQEERSLQDLNAQPGFGAWFSGIAGALGGGNWSGLIDLVMGALGAGGLAQAMRYKSRAQRMADKAVELAEEEPAVARKLAACDPDITKHRRKKS